jgi:hypothetical protein
MQKFTFTFFAIFLINSVIIKGQTGLDLPYSQTFSVDSLYKIGWETLNYGSNTSDYWYISSSANAGGTTGEVFHSTKYAYSSKAMLVSPALNTSGVSELQLSFNYYLKEQNQGYVTKLVVQSSTDGEIWTDEAWNITAGYRNGTTGPYTVNTIVKQNTNSLHTYIAFALVGDLAAVNNWSIDNVEIKAFSSCNGPATQASNLNFSNNTGSSVTLSWTRGNGTDGVLVVARKGAAIESIPLNFIAYTANTVMGSGSNLGAGAYCVYKGTGNSVTVTNLAGFSDYYFSIYEYNTGNCYNLQPLTGKVFMAAAGTKVWQGKISEDWSVKGNWQGNALPGANDNVVIPSECPNFPSLYNKATIKSLQLLQGAQLRLEKTSDLQITDSLCIYGTAYFMNGSVNAGAIYSYPKATIYQTDGTITTTKWAGGPTKNYGYGMVYISGGTLNVSENMRLAYTSDNSAGLNMSGNETVLNVGGSLNFSSPGEFSGGTINLLGTSGAGPFEFAQQAGGYTAPKAFHLNVNAPAKTYVFNNTTASYIISGNFNIIAGNVNLTGASYATSLNIKGNVTIGQNGVLNCGNASLFGNIIANGDWNNYSAGTFISGSNTVSFSGNDQKIKGSTTFHNLSLNSAELRTVTFESGTAKRVTVKGTFSVSSNFTGKTALRSDTAGIQWEIDPQGTRNISNADIQDSKNMNAAAINVSGSQIINSGNNTNWVFNASPTILCSSATLPDFGSVAANSVSTETSYLVSATNLTSNLTITPPAGFQVSKTPYLDFTNSLILSPVSGSVPCQTIYVRMNPASAGNLSGNITHTATGAATINVAVSGTATSAAPVIIINPATTNIGMGIVPIGLSSAESSYFVHGSNLTSDLTVTVTGEFEITKTPGSNYSQSVTFTQTGGIASGMVYYRYTPLNSYSSGTISHTSAGAATVTKTIWGNGSWAGSLNISKSALPDFGNVEINTSSALDSFNLAGSNLYHYIFVRASDGFQVSYNRQYGFSSQILINTNNGSISDTTLYVKFLPNVKGACSGSVQISSSNTLYKYVTVSGTGTCGTSPAVTFKPASVAFPNTFVNTVSEIKNIVIEGCSLSGNVSLTANNGFELSFYPNKNFNDTLIISPVSGSISDTNIYIRIIPSEIRSYSGQVTIKANNAQDKYIYLSCTGFYAGSPLVWLSTDTIASYGTVELEDTSEVKTYKLSGNYLTSDLTIVSPDGFVISTVPAPASSFNDTLVIPANNQSIADTTVYVMFVPKEKKEYASFIKHTSAGLADKLVHVSGTGIHSVIALSATTVPSFGNVMVNAVSAVDSFLVSGYDLSAGITITAPDGFEVSKTRDADFISAITLPAINDTVDTTTVYVRFKPLLGGYYNGAVTVTSGKKTKTVQVSGKGIGPMIVTSVSALPSFGDVVKNDTSDVASFTVHGEYLTTGITIQAPAGFEISTALSSGFASSLSLALTGDSVAHTTIFVRFIPTLVQDYTGTIQFSSAGATGSVSVSGKGTASGVAVFTQNHPKVRIYPNPAVDRVYINYPGKEEILVEVLDIRGNCHIRQQAASYGISELDIAGLPAGTYVIKLTGNKFVLLSKLLKR